MEGKWEDQRENTKMGQMDKWGKWRANGRTNGGNMEKATIWREWGKWRAYVLIYAPICTTA